MGRRGIKKASSSNSGYGWYKSAPRPKPAGEGVRGDHFGTTWWGEQFLQAFTGMSDENRLPRGRTYARNGSVQRLDIVLNKVAAKVQGSYLYDIDIEFPLFTEKQKSLLIELIMQRPDLLSQLLNRQLPAELLEICETNTIELFPSNWSKFKAACACPDYAQPCKHLAAVIYLMANVVDRNPFAVFEWHGLDLPGELEALGMQATAGITERVPYLSDYYAEARPKVPHAEPFWWNQLDFGMLPQGRTVLEILLKEKPVFGVKPDIKTVMLSNLGRVSKGLIKERNELQIESAGKYERIVETEIWLNESGQFLDFTAWDADGNIMFDTSQIEILLKWLGGITAALLPRICDELSALWIVTRYTEALTRNMLIVPQIMRIKDDTYNIRWIPAEMHEAVRTMHHFIQERLPNDLVLYKIQGRTEEVMFHPIATDYLTTLSGVFIQGYLAKYNEYSFDPLSKMFIFGQPIPFSKQNDRDTPAMIKLWLQRLFILEKPFLPMIRVEEERREMFSVEVLVEEKSKTAEPATLEKISNSAKWKANKMAIFQMLSDLAEFMPLLNDLMRDQGKKPVLVPASEFSTLLFEQLPLMKLLGMKVLLPKALFKVLRPALSVKLSTQGGTKNSTGILNLQTMLDYEWRVAIGEDLISQADFLQMVKQASGLVKWKDTYVYLSGDEIQKLTEQLAKPQHLDPTTLLQVALSQDYNGQSVMLSPELESEIKQVLTTPDAPTPKEINARLRPYQLRGFAWLLKNTQLGMGSILADDMGLGKTLQVITLMQHLKNTDQLSPKLQALIVAPTTLLTNWSRELTKFAPNLIFGIFHGTTRDLKNLTHCDVILTTYGAVRTDQKVLSKYHWRLVVIDEAQAIKNYSAEQTKAVKALKADVRIAMSGTPVENRLSEYWSIFDFTLHGYLGNIKHFNENYAKPIEVFREKAVLTKFHKVTAPFIMRRLKTDKSIITDLPDKLEINHFPSLTKEQGALYQATVAKTMQLIETGEAKQRSGLVLNLIMGLKQICNHPAQFLKKGKRTGDLSGKIPVLIDILREALDQGDKVLIFTQFTEMGDLLVEILENELGFAVPFLHGALTRARRDQLVDEFQHKQNTKVMILSLKAAGTGLNLTEANQVVHFDLWWNPAVETQATDRVYRIGQSKRVLAHRLVTGATFEEKIDLMIQKKKELSNLTVVEGEQWIGQLSNTELRSLFSLE